MMRIKTKRNNNNNRTMMNLWCHLMKGKKKAPRKKTRTIKNEN